MCIGQTQSKQDRKDDNLSLLVPSLSFPFMYNSMDTVEPMEITSGWLGDQWQRNRGIIHGISFKEGFPLHEEPLNS
jgi:hypothetical protein